mgnify:CR=1 FL=1
MKVFIRVDASLKMGTGHVMRCLTLAHVLKESNMQVNFICRKHDGNLIDKIRINGFNVFELKPPIGRQYGTKFTYLHWLEVTQKQDAVDCIAVVSKIKADLIIVDHYGIGEEWHRYLKEYCNKLMVIDDLADRKFICDILLNQNLGIKQKAYKNKVPSDCCLLLGSDYALLRSEFLRLRDQALYKRRKISTINNVLISMGGNDPKNITYDILQKIENDINITVVLGLGSPHIEMIKEYAAYKNIKIIVDANNMAELMLASDLAIGAGGSTSWERCCLGLPTVLLILAENQQKIGDNLARIGAVIALKYDNIAKDSVKDAMTILMKNKNKYTRMCNISAKICDGKGAKRVTGKILSVCFEKRNDI